MKRALLGLVFGLAIGVIAGRFGARAEMDDAYDNVARYFEIGIEPGIERMRRHSPCGVRDGDLILIREDETRLNWWIVMFKPYETSFRDRYQALAERMNALRAEAMQRAKDCE